MLGTADIALSRSKRTSNKSTVNSEKFEIGWGKNAIL